MVFPLLSFLPFLSLLFLSFICHILTLLLRLFHCAFSLAFLSLSHLFLLFSSLFRFFFFILSLSNCPGKSVSGVGWDMKVRLLFSCLFSVPYSLCQILPVKLSLVSAVIGKCISSFLYILFFIFSLSSSSGKVVSVGCGMEL